MGLSRDTSHKRRSTGGRQVAIHQKRKYDIARPPALTRIGEKKISLVRGRGGNMKRRGLKLDAGNFSWPSESVTRKSRVVDVVYNATNNEFVRMKVLTKGAIVQIDATPFRQYYVSHYNKVLGKRKGKAIPEADQAILDRPKSNSVGRKIAAREPLSKIEQAIDEQAATGRLLACVTSRPGQSGRCDGYILEGKELEFYKRKLAKK